MISEEFINNLAIKYQTSEINIRREYFQHLFLSYFYQQPDNSNIYFKGGTALRLLYSSPRFSEDLDFNCAFIKYKEIEEILLNTLFQIEKENIRFDLKEAKETTGGFLAVIIFEAYGQSIDIQLEISLREEEKKSEILAVKNDYIPPYNVVTVTEKQLVSEKIRALLQRKKPRDFYDFYFILRSRLPVPQKQDVLPKVVKALNESNINFEGELKHFLPKTHWLIIKDFKSTLKRELERFV